jgi:hypothetical protein
MLPSVLAEASTVSSPTDSALLNVVYFYPSSKIQDLPKSPCAAVGSNVTNLVVELRSGLTAVATTFSAKSLDSRLTPPQISKRSLPALT